MLSTNQRRALDLIRSNVKPRDMMPAGHALINANVKALLAAGAIVHDPRKRSGYRVVRDRTFVCQNGDVVSERDMFRRIGQAMKDKKKEEKK